LFCVWDGELLAIEARTGRVLWSHSPPGARLNLAGHGKLFPTLAFGERSILVQRAGERWLIDQQGGRALHQERDAVEPWPPPRATADRAVVQRGHELACIDLATGEEAWKHALPDESLLTGAPAELHLNEAKLIALVPTNVGLQIECLDARTGKPAWSLLGINPGEVKEHPSGWAIDASAFYLVEDDHLTARSLDDGKRLWRRAIEPGEWQLFARGGTVLAWRGSFKETSFQFRWLGRMVQWDLRVSLDDLRWGCPLLIHDARTGEQIARADLPADRTRLKRRAGGAAFSLMPKLSQEQRRTEHGPRVQMTPQGVIIQSGDRLWKVDCKFSEKGSQ
jgi:hypothetical protein